MSPVTAFSLGILLGFLIGMIRAHKWWKVYQLVKNGKVLFYQDSIGKEEKNK